MGLFAILELLLNKDDLMSKKQVEDEGIVKARPQIEGLDPLAGADRLHNNSNTEDATHYEVDNSERKTDEAGVVNRPLPSNPTQPTAQQTDWSLPPHKVKNASKAEQDKVAKGRKE